MGFKNGAFATVWQVDPDTDNHTKIQISINRKVKLSADSDGTGDNLQHQW